MPSPRNRTKDSLSNRFVKLEVKDVIYKGEFIEKNERMNGN